MVPLLNLLEHVVVVVVFLAFLGVYQRGGWRELLRLMVVGVKQVPGVAAILDSVLRKEARSFIQTTKLSSGSSGAPATVVLPVQGIPKDDLLQKLDEIRKGETDHLDGKVFAYTYTLTDQHFQLQQDVFDIFTEKIGYSPEHDDLVKYVQKAFLHENALNPMIYPSLRQMETEVVSMTAAMMNGDADSVGFLTSGGTESILMAVKAYRNRARALYPWIKHPEIVCPTTQHPAIAKAAHYFGLSITYVPVGQDLTPDVAAMEKALTDSTVMVACSAPQYCHGVVDPVEELSNMAAKHGIPCHVDACFGGFMLPWVEKLGYDVPKWDFRCPGVTSLSADVHKYGYTVKGASVVVYRNNELRKHQIFASTTWPGGLYGSPSMAGTRPGGNIAAAWAAMNSLGEEGYMAKARTLMDITERMKEGVQSIECLKIMGHPHMTCFAIGSSDPEVDILAVADLMENKGWTIERNQNPSCIHCTILPHHQVSSDLFVQQLRDSALFAKGNQHLSRQGTAGIYGMMAAVPDSSILDDFIKEFFAQIYRLQ